MSTANNEDKKSGDNKAQQPEHKTQRAKATPKSPHTTESAGQLKKRSLGSKIRDVGDRRQEKKAGYSGHKQILWRTQRRQLEPKGTDCHLTCAWIQGCNFVQRQKENIKNFQKTTDINEEGQQRPCAIISRQKRLNDLFSRPHTAIQKV